MPLEKRVLRVSPCSELDPDWGNIHPEKVEVYKIKVSPASNTRQYQFIALLPDTGSEESSIELLKEVLVLFLEPEDGFSVLEFNEEMLESWEANGSCGAVLSHDPRTIGNEMVEFLWLFPPDHLLF